MKAETEKLRQEYRPDQVKVLFVGESPPAGGTFFYAGDSNLVRYTHEAFGLVFSGINNVDIVAFLNFFRDAGCYMEDLCLVPINHLDPQDRRRAREANVKGLRRRIDAVKPQEIVVVMKGIEPQVREATAKSIHLLPFPAQGHQRAYVSGLAQLLTGFVQRATL